MPSHITHAIFAEETWNLSFSSPPTAIESPWVVQGSTGPDPLFSGISRKPTAFEWGYRIHREGYGRVAASIAAQAGEALSSSRPSAEALRAYALAFSSHAVLDRHTHPLVNYRSGWEEEGEPESAHLRFCHPHMERIIDMIMLRNLRGCDLKTYAYPSRRPTREDKTIFMAPLLARAITESYDDIPPTLDIGLCNALADDDDFFALFDPSVPGGGTELAVEMESRGELPERVLGLFHPEVIPPGDFLNLERASWKDPRLGEKKQESFLDLFHEALGEAVRIMKIADGVISGRQAPGTLAEALGDGDLNDTAPGGGDAHLNYREPMEIAPLIDAMYEALRDSAQHPYSEA